MSEKRVFNKSLNKRLRSCQANVSRGFTLLELLIVMIIVAIGVTLAVPTYEDIIERRHTTAKAQNLAAFMAYARSAAVKRNKRVSISLSYTNANEWCVGITDLPAGCDCKADATQCVINGVQKTLSSVTHARSSMTAHSVDTTFVFDPVRGTKIAADLGDHTYDLQSDNSNWKIRVIVGATGRVRLCNSDSTKAVPGFEPCI